LYAEAIVKGDSLPYFEIARWDIFKYYTKEINPLDGGDCPLIVWAMIFSVFWPIVLVVVGFSSIHKLILKRIRKRLEGAVLLHPDQEVREYNKGFNKKDQ